jgi:SAM-dependent methyltransferase
MTMAEAFQPVAVRSPSENRWLFALRCVVDLQLLTIFRFLRPNIGAWRGRVLDVGAGEAPWRDLMPDAKYFGVDVDSAREFGMRTNPDITYYDGRRLPFADGNFDHVLLVEVLEHVPDPVAFLTELKRVVRPGGSLVMTVPWSARIHHLPHDYTRFTPYRLNDMLTSVGFGKVTIEERGNDIAVIANKLLILTVRLLRPAQRRNLLWTWVPAAITAPFTLIFLLAAHGAMLLGAGSKEDPLGYGVVAVKN